MSQKVDRQFDYLFYLQVFNFLITIRAKKLLIRKAKKKDTIIINISGIDNPKLPCSKVYLK